MLDCGMAQYPPDGDGVVHRHNGCCRRGSAGGGRLQAKRLGQHLAKVVRLMTGIVRVVEANPGPEIAARLIQAAAEYPGTRLDVGAEVVPQPQEGGRDADPPVPRHVRQPNLVDLHRAISTVALVLPLTRPSRPPSTLSRITSMAGGRRCACAAARRQLSITLPAVPGWLTLMPTGVGASRYCDAWATPNEKTTAAGAGREDEPAASWLHASGGRGGARRGCCLDRAQPQAAHAVVSRGPGSGSCR